MFILSHAMTKLINVCDKFYFDCEDGLSVALSYGYDFTKIEEMERDIGVPQNVGFASFANRSPW